MKDIWNQLTGRLGHNHHLRLSKMCQKVAVANDLFAGREPPGIPIGFRPNRELTTQSRGKGTLDRFLQVCEFLNRVTVALDCVGTVFESTATEIPGSDQC